MTNQNEIKNQNEDIDEVSITHHEAPVEKEEVSFEEIKAAALAVNHEEFDWNDTGNQFTVYTDAERAKMEAIIDGTLNSVEKNEILDGIVMGITNREVILNIGFKSDGMVSLAEFRDMPELKIGDTVEVFVEEREDKTGQLVLSRRRAKTQRSWDLINKALEDDTILVGLIKSRTKGGLIVDIMGVEAFLPGSQIDVKPIKDYDVYLGKTMEFKVVKINHDFRNVVVSHKVLIEDDIESQKLDIISKLEKGQVLEGVVKNVTAFGVFVDLGGVDGLLHITDIAWGRVEHPEEILKMDDKINVVVLDFDDEKKRIALGMKQLQPHPWESVDAALETGSKIKGKIVTVADYGAFLELSSGVEGLIHVSEMSWSQHLRNPSEYVKVGDEVEAVILTIDREERKMSLGMKQLTTDPWANVTTDFPVGSKHNATVKNMTNYGVFVEMDKGIDGLIHISDLSWTKKINHPHEFSKVGDKLDVVVLESDAENRRLSLGVKQLEENPWDTFETIFNEGSLHKGTVIKMVDKGAIIALPYGIEGFAPLKQLAREDGKTGNTDDVLDFMVIEFNKENKRIVVSHSRLWEVAKEEERAVESKKRKEDSNDTEKAIKKVKSNVEKSTLGDLDVLSSLKADLEKSEGAK